MAATFTFYNSFAEYLGDGTFDLNSDTIKVALVSSSYTFAATHTVWADASANEVSNSGYTAGGATLSVTYNRSSNVLTFDATDTAWTASGSSLVSRRAVIYKSGTANSRVNPLIASILLDNTPADVTVTAGNTLTLQWNGSGIFTVTV